MFRFTYRIAEILLRVESGTRVTDLEKPRYQDFAVNDTNFDMLFSNCIIEPGRLSNTPLTTGNGLLAHRIKSLDIQQQQLFLRSPEVVAALESSSQWPEQIFVEGSSKLLTITDFVQHRVDQFLFSESVAASPPLRLGLSTVSSFLFDFDALMVHSSSVVLDNKCAVFLAPNEGGKTTTSRLAPPGAVILADDQNIIRRAHEQFYVHGTPWALVYNSQMRAPLGGFFILKQAPAFALQPIKPRHAVEFMWGEYRYAWLKLPPDRKLHAMDMVQTICNSVPVYLMSFPKNHVDWDAISHAME